jgi:DMSO/TMAO reductase YedYZ molybdopterin-dependent catalytic subunit
VKPAERAIPHKETHMSLVSRGFGSRRRDADADSARVPPGQHVTHDFPVLSAGPTPDTPVDRWTFSIETGGVLRTWTWEPAPPNDLGQGG